MGVTNYLFAMPGFLNGVASVLDLGGTLFHLNTFDSPQESDSYAIYNDFCATGSDLHNAMESLIQ